VTGSDNKIDDMDQCTFGAVETAGLLGFAGLGFMGYRQTKRVPPLLLVECSRAERAPSSVLRT
jgi:hypothetical protein